MHVETNRKSNDELTSFHQIDEIAITSDSDSQSLSSLSQSKDTELTPLKNYTLNCHNSIGSTKSTNSSSQKNHTKSAHRNFSLNDFSIDSNFRKLFNHYQTNKSTNLDYLQCEQNDAVVDDVSIDLPSSLKFNKNSMSISVKKFHENEQKNYENIVCSPNFTHIQQQHQLNQHDRHNSMSDFMQNQRNLMKLYNDQSIDVATVSSVANASIVASNQEKLNECLVNPMRQAVVLRNPRGNQARAYSTDSLYAALMDVKAGESIYR